MDGCVRARSKRFASADSYADGYASAHLCWVLLFTLLYVVQGVAKLSMEVFV